MRWRRREKAKPSEPSQPDGSKDYESSRMMGEAVKWARRNAITDRVALYMWTAILGVWIALVFTDGDASARIIRIGAISFYIFALLMMIMARRHHRDAKARYLSMQMAEKVMQEITSDYIWGEAFVVTCWNRTDVVKTANEVGALSAVRGVAMAGRPPWADQADT